MIDWIARRRASRRLVHGARHLAAARLSPGSSGNLSVRVGESIIMTPTGSALSRVRVRDLARVRIVDGRVEKGIPSKEVTLHLAAYRAAPEATAIVHLHAPASTAIACLAPLNDGSAALPAYTPYRVMSLGTVPLLPFAAPGTAALGDDVGAAVAEGHRVVLLAHHGSVVVAASLDRALDLSEELEASAELSLRLHGRDALQLSTEQQGELPRP